MSSHLSIFLENVGASSTPWIKTLGIKTVYIRLLVTRSDLYWCYFTSESPRWCNCSVLAIGTKVRGFKPGLGDGFLRAVKIRRTPSFGGEVKPEATCRKILQHVKELYEYERGSCYLVPSYTHNNNFLVLLYISSIPQFYYTNCSTCFGLL
jgi:hypothetical protein